MQVMKNFEFESYKEWVNQWIKGQPKGGHGQLRSMAADAGVNSVVMSQVFRGDRDITIEQALRVAKYMGLSELERDLFLLLVQKDRAGSHDLKLVFARQIAELKARARTLSQRIKHESMTNEDKATFYSKWYYSAVRLGVSIPQLSTISEIAERLGLDRSLVANVVAFLLDRRLIVEKNGRLDMGPQVTHVGHDSPFVGKHHTNWRIRGLHSMDQSHPSNLFYSGPMALSTEASEKIRTLLIGLIEQATAMAAASDSQSLKCLNLDWFEI